MGRWLRSSWIAFFGRTSNSVHLFHPLILSVTFLAAAETETINSLHSAGLSALVFMVTLVFCPALYRWFEKPILNYGARWKY
jgi:peptidoglycan/LPS O-acetylase OafA/YrhL